MKARPLDFQIPEVPMRAGFWIGFSFLSLLFAAFLELNKNTIAGWILLAILAALFIVLYRNVLLQRPWYLKLAFWLLYIALFAGIAAITWPPVRAIAASEDRNPEATAAVRTDKGLVSGVTTAGGAVEVFAGIPYAKPPVGELRWKAPQEPDAWEGVLVCDHFAPMSMQKTNLPVYDSLVRIIGYHDYRISLSDNYIPPVSEDSLYLNVWKPAGDVHGLPVLVYIHGGSLQTGQSWYSDYNGTTFAKEGIVVVNLSYRLGVFGFLADSELLESEGTTGNYGLLDQIMALEWVQKNIEAFGGDPSNVTIAGESAGAVCIDALCVSPLAKGLFRRAILESSTLSCVEPPHSYRTLDDALSSGKALMERYNASSISDLKELSAKAIVGEMDTQHHLTVDGYALPDSPYNLRRAGIHNEEAILHGFNDRESGPFIIFSHASMKNYETKVRAYFKEYADDVLAVYPAETDSEADEYWAEIYGAVFFNYPHYCLNRLAASEGIPVYEYLFTKTNGRLSSWHSGELIYAFNRIPDDSGLFDISDRNLAADMNSYWRNFITCGNPNGEGLPDFPQNTDSKKLLELGTEISVIDEPYLALYGILDRMQASRVSASD